ncbi:Glutamine synthetase type I [Caballeronia glathei]|nr:Glutamine synthetase type I [Caballeronia glathei]CDY78816.1 Glutamine synthetase type I [Caballeronia glathei]
MCAGLDQALDALDADREFLTRGGVFTDSMLDAYIELKTGELQRYRQSVHPIEFEMYYSL